MKNNEESHKPFVGNTFISVPTLNKGLDQMVFLKCSVRSVKVKGKDVNREK